MPKIHQNTFGGRALPGPAGELMRSPRLPSRNGGLVLRGERRGLFLRGRRGGKGGETGRKEKEFLAKVEKSRINTASDYASCSGVVGRPTVDPGDGDAFTQSND